MKVKRDDDVLALRVLCTFSPFLAALKSSSLSLDSTAQLWSPARHPLHEDTPPFAMTCLSAPLP